MRLVILLLCLPFCAGAQTSFAPRDIKKLSVEELMNIEVTLVSRTPEKISEAPSAIQVITGEDIRRSGATNVPEALRLIPNLQVAQFSANVWLISARGFNSIFSNKLLVMIDGRTVYTPLYAGVLWDQQNVLLEDVDRIEVVSGPGGTLWGANAVNGIINIVTKHTSETRGLYASATAGTFLKDQAAVRYGSKINDKISYKIFARHFDRDATKSATSNDNKDDWSMTHAGFRMDWNPTKNNAYTVQGDYYDGNRNAPKDRSPLNGQNILARWTRTISDKSDLMLQVYYDRYYREDAPSASYDKINTVDIDFQHRLPLGKRNNFIWGAGYRYAKDDANFPPSGGITPRFKRLDLYSGFVRDEISIARNITLAFGTKVLHNVYTGLEWQPDIRLAWINKGSTLWTAVSRAVRTPSRLDVDYFIPLTPQPPTTP
ncbi:MAG TPA: TonB-dependent receptor plug domain-containing protein, partial [Chitinophagaceae bacterium]|nr:TonB-dependent receptor plug domain-containing protein [Chitinophagaceae bacterium]